ncbi:MAG: hypothetical protein R2813_03355 [Flavobacteriales bacterium]
MRQSTVINHLREDAFEFFLSGYLCGGHAWGQMYNAEVGYDLCAVTSTAFAISFSGCEVAVRPKRMMYREGHS